MQKIPLPSLLDAECRPDHRGFNVRAEESPIDATPPTHPVKRVRQSFAGFSNSELNELSKAKNFARWLGRSESLLRNVKNRAVPLSKNLARRISERTGVDVKWLLSDPLVDSTEAGQGRGGREAGEMNEIAEEPIRASGGGHWDPRLILEPLVLGDFDFRQTLPMAPQLLLQLALALVEVGCSRALEQSDNAPLIRLMELIKREIDVTDPAFLAAIEGKLNQPGNADALQLWTVAHLAAKQRRAGRE